MARFLDSVVKISDFYELGNATPSELAAEFTTLTCVYLKR